MESHQRVYLNTASALRLMIANSLWSQKNFKDDFNQYEDPLAWLNEFCTIRLAGPRRSGHTEAMIKVALEMFNHPRFIVLNDEHRQSLRDRLPIKDIFTPYDIKGRMRGTTRDMDALFVDCAWNLSSSQEKDIFALCAIREPPFCLVFLQ